MMDELLINEKVPIAENEKERLARLRSYNILDTQVEQSFDRIAEVASFICDTPIALVAFQDEERNWFKAAIGTEGVRESPRQISFCQHTIMGEEVYEVTDASQDALFADNPLVCNDPRIRFYAGAPLVDQEGFRLGTLCVVDQKPKRLTDRQKSSLQVLADEVMARLQLRMLLHKEVEVNKMRSNFISMATHQLRTPLAVVQSNMDLLVGLSQNGVGIDADRLNKISGRVDKELVRMTSLIDDVMKSGKSQLTSFNLNMEEVEVVSVCQKIKERLDQIQIDGRMLDLEVVGKQRSWFLDKEKLNDILENLLTNAFKYSPKAQNPKLVVNFSHPDVLTIQVQDSGIGIPQEELENLFSPFYRAHNAGEIEGTGLGLNIVKDFTELQNGTIDVQSKSSRTTFTLTFPSNR